MRSANVAGKKNTQTVLKICIPILNSFQGEKVAKDLGCEFSPVDVSKEEDVLKALEKAKGLNAVVNCAGIGVAFKTYNFNKNVAHSLDDFVKVQMVNTVGTFNVIRLASGVMGKNEPDEDNQVRT